MFSTASVAAKSVCAPEQHPRRASSSTSPGPFSNWPPIPSRATTSGCSNDPPIVSRGRRWTQRGTSTQAWSGPPVPNPPPLRPPATTRTRRRSSGRQQPHGPATAPPAASNHTDPPPLLRPTASPADRISYRPHLRPVACPAAPPTTPGAWRAAPRISSCSPGSRRASRGPGCTPGSSGRNWVRPGTSIAGSSAGRGRSPRR